ncbi:hypothetical protein GBAR_LOCUS5833 [Geodia barretti]|uniref:Ig-like domain-containing protein n=1 Tax=Geodia barretti TaxID=519541 RepID=A0AA35RD52_GEOBA|nr:hypothetical protein GBAR_LOCUS5833 [Geodia barretti]
MWRLLFVLELLVSTARGEIQIHFEEAQYTFPESSRVCVSVRHVGGPAPRRFSISYSFDVSLIGQRLGAGTLQGTQLFNQGATTTTFCLGTGGGRDNQVCENDTHGSITLINSSAIRLVEPYVTRITITDDEFVFASFDQQGYILTEGTSRKELSLAVNSVLSKSITFHLTPDPELDANGPLALLTTELSYQAGTDSASVAVKLRDNTLGLEQPQVVSLGIILSSAECYDLAIAPTLITILDNDMVKLGFTEDKVIVKESEGEARLCVSITPTIARPLNFIIIHDAITAAKQARGGSIFGQLPAHSNSSGRCFTVPFLVDDIIGNDRRFTAQLDVDRDTYPTGVVIDNPSLTVSIQDTSKCYNILVDNSTAKLVLVPPQHSVCFQCLFHIETREESDISWKIGGRVLQSDVGEVLSNGTLQVTNSSSLFHKTSVVTLTCSSRDGGVEFTFPVLLEGGEVEPPHPSKSSSASSGHSLNQNAAPTLITLFVCALELGLMAGTGGPYVSAVLCAFAALCLLLHITAVCGRVVSYPPLPVLFAEGSNYDVGHQIGSAFSSQILTVMDSNSFFNSKMLSYNSTAEGGAVYSRFYHSVATAYPQYLDELRGMADGANISFSKLFLWNMMFEWEMMLESNKDLPTPACSDLYLTSDNRTIMGHNEDGGTISVNNSFVVHARITQPGSDLVEEFTAMCYAAELCGNAFGFNVKSGVVFTVNAVFPKTVNTSAIPRNYLNRLGLSVDGQEFLAALNSVPCASGFSLNLGNLASLTVANVEVWSGGANVFQVSGYNYHFNMCYTDPSSQHRLARVKQLPPPTDSAGVISILGDTGDPQYPIFRTATPPDSAATIATALFDLGAEKKIFYMYRGNPAHVKPSLVIPLQ